MNIGAALKVGSETPYMVIDEDQVRKNISKVQRMASTHDKKLRPHSKTHKIPELSRWQISEGAVGVCVQKVAEAEVMFEGGIQSILISNEVVDRRKTDRIAELSASGCDISVAVDSIYGSENLSESAKNHGVRIPVFPDLDLGMHRCGVPPERLDAFIDSLTGMAGLTVDGIMAYDGNVAQQTKVEREKAVAAESRVLEPIISKFRQRGLGNGTLTVGGTPSSEIWAEYDYVNELQPGTYVYYDLRCAASNLCSMSDIGMGVVAQVMSRSESGDGRVTLDAGYKSISVDQGVYPEVYSENGLMGKVTGMSEEHTVLDVGNREVEIGQTVVMLPYHTCTTSDYWDEAWMFSGSHSPRTVAVKGRGKRE